MLSSVNEVRFLTGRFVCENSLRSGSMRVHQRLQCYTGIEFDYDDAVLEILDTKAMVGPNKSRLSEIWNGANFDQSITPSINRVGPTLDGSTGLVCSLPHRKWREKKLQPSRDKSGQQLICCLYSLHFLWGILRTSRVDKPRARKADSCWRRGEHEQEVLFSNQNMSLIP